MVMEFKLASDDARTWPVELDVVQDVTGNAPPWYVVDHADQTARYYGVCPWCDNPVQMVGLVRGNGVPHGRHCSKSVAGFVSLDIEALQSCPYKLRGRPRLYERRGLSPVADKIRGIAIDHFDRVIHVLRADTGIAISPTMAERWLRAWLAAEGYLYRAAHLRNIPWMVALFAPASNLFGQPLLDPVLIEALERRFGIGVVGDGRLIARPGHIVNVGFSFDGHCVTALEGGQVRESIRIRVRDMSATDIIPDAPVPYRRSIDVEPHKFERLMAAGDDHPARNAKLREIARKVAEEFGYA